MVGPEHLAAHLHHRPGFVWLDGGKTGWHILSWAPTSVVETADDWVNAARRLRGAPHHSDAPFTSGVLGYVGYGAGWCVEAVPEQAPTPEPPVWLGYFPHSVCYRAGRWFVHGGAAFRDEVAHLLALPAAPPVVEPPSRAATTQSKEAYLARVHRILDLIGVGDCYQVNLSRPVFVDLDDPFDTYRRLRALSDASMGGWMRPRPDVAILSNSPETLLSIDGHTLVSDPIKGTRPRGSDAVSDQAHRHDLQTHPKDHAELAMIVDLVRNDLGRIAELGSVRADRRVVQTHAYVHHANWPVTATLAKGRDAWDALAAVFPPGSVTGAPKVRATERINELESHPRGVYCGTMGFLDDRGNGQWSVAIRTAVWSASTLRYHVGGGIVADSNPLEEWEETEHKGRMLSRAAGVSPRSSPSRPPRST